jgi:hypothetical protein
MRIGKRRGLGFLAAGFFLAAVAGAATQAMSADKDIPHYVNDPSWPKPFANHWVIGQIGGLAVDDHDHIWVLQRALPYAVDDHGMKHDLALADRMPAVLEFDAEGNILKSWGGQGHVPDWPKSEHALWVDKATPPLRRATMPTPPCWASRPGSRSIAPRMRSISPTAISTAVS